MKLENIMTTRVATLEMDDSLATAKEIFENTKFHHLPVLEGGALRGIISDRDLWRNLSPFLHTASERSQDIHTLKKRVHQIMTREVITATRETNLTDAVQSLMTNHISCLPVVSTDGKLEGIVTLRDLLKALVKQMMNS